MESKHLIVVPHVGTFEEEDIVKFLGNLHRQMEEWETLNKFSDGCGDLLGSMPPSYENSQLDIDLREVFQHHTASIRRNIHTLVHQLFEKAKHYD